MKHVPRWWLILGLVVGLGLNQQPAQAASPTSGALLRHGWDALVQDHDTTALRAFGAALAVARREANAENEAAALLYLGITSYGASLTQGLDYAMRAMKAYERLPAPRARVGRGRCLQLLATIYSRQGRFTDAIRLERQALAIFPSPDTTTYRGLIFAGLGSAYERLGQPDSAARYYLAALAERQRTRQVVYLPGSYINVADLRLRAGQAPAAYQYYQQALQLADSTGNRQAQVMAWLGLARWNTRFGGADSVVRRQLRQAETLASQLADRSFLVNTLAQRVAYLSRKADYQGALNAQQALQRERDQVAETEKQHALARLTVQFEVAEKDRQLRLIAQEKEVARLTNYLLFGALTVLLLGGLALFLFFRRIKQRDQQLLQAQQDLLVAQAEQKRLREEQLRNEIEFRESQLSALALQMRQKNELLQELKTRFDAQPNAAGDIGVERLLHKGAGQDREWADFNAHFESLNRNFYNRLRERFPSISPSELKLCALIKLNLSMKEMAGILNISPDSVKTARYRLRRKLGLATEDNLTTFIMNLT